MFVFKNFKCQQQKTIYKTIEKLNFRYTSSSTNPAPAPDNKTPPAETLKVTYGQPTAYTHPHLIDPGFLVPGVAVKEFQQRRERLITGLQKFTRDLDQNGQTNANQVVIIPSSTKKYMSEKIPYVFRQNSDFFYLTGCLEPDSILMISITEQNEVKSTLFMRPKDPHSELWDGPRTGPENSIKMFGVDEAYSTGAFSDVVERTTKDKKPMIWYDTKSSELVRISKALKQVLASFPPFHSPTNFVQGMRLFKSAAEQNLMRKTCEIASVSINEVMKESRPGCSEHHINAAMEFKCRIRNASYLAYPPVVATGNNATTIHYINNTQQTKSGDMVLMDAGCEYGGYTSDITRTWPINGEFTEPQKILYEVVSLLQKDLIGLLLKEGGDTLDNLFDSMCLKLGKYLQEAGLIPKTVTDKNSLSKAGYKFCPHHVSHYLGMDVHDTALIPRNVRLLPGMVCTVEPGIYIPSNRMDVPEEFRGMGVRIEDNILITKDNEVEVLTSKCLKDREDLENLFNNSDISISTPLQFW